MAVALGYQNIGQVYHHYGSDGGDAVLGSIGTMIFLPGLDHRTAEYASKRIGQATVWQSTSVDVKEGTKFDSERTSEVGRSLMDASELRRMVKYRQAVAIIGNAPPVRFSYPPIAKLGASRKACLMRQTRRVSSSVKRHCRLQLDSGLEPQAKQRASSQRTTAPSFHSVK